MEPSAVWCPVCFLEITPGALRCRYCGAYFQGRHKCEPINVPPIQVSYGSTGPEVDDQGFPYQAGMALSFNQLREEASDESDGRLHDPGLPSA